MSDASGPPIRPATLDAVITAALGGNGEIGLLALERVAAAGLYTRRAVAGYASSSAPYASFGHDARQTIASYRALHRVVLRDALVFDQGNVITRDGMLITDSSWEMLQNRLIPKGLVGTPETGLRLALTAATEIAVPALLAKRPWWANFGHWLVDAAALLALLAPRIRAEQLHVVIGDFRDPAMNAIVQECLDAILPGVPVLRQPNEATWRFKALHYVSPVHRPPLFKLPAALQALRDAIMPRPRLARPHRRLYLQRPGAAKRRMVNEAQILALLGEYGFEAIDPSAMSLHAQADLFAQAEAVAGVKGAAMTNLIFADPACRVLAFSPAAWEDTFFWDIAGQRDQAYAELFGPCHSVDRLPPDHDFEIDPGLTREMLRRLGLA